MISLLPPKNKEEISQEENWKLVMILGSLFLIFLISLSLILFSIKTFISGELEAQKVLLELKAKEFQEPQVQSLQENLINFNQTLSHLNSFYGRQLNLTEILEKISQTLPVGAHLTNLSLNYPQVSLSGFSSTREILLKFKENLEKERQLQEVYFPPANWVKPTDINFTVSFKVK